MVAPLVPYVTPYKPVKKFLYLPPPYGYYMEFPVYSRRVLKGFRQKKPYNLPTEYYLEELRLISGIGDGTTWGWSAKDTIAKVKADNMARSIFINKLGDASSFGATVTAEAKETWSTVVSTITRLATAAKHVRRLELAKAAKQLGIPYREYRVERWPKRRSGKRTSKIVAPRFSTHIDFGSGRSYVKSAASGWLLWSYGAKPLIDDCNNGMRVLTQELPSKIVDSWGRGRWDSREVSSGSYIDRSAVVRVKYRAQVSVSNPNLWLANQLGLINPIQFVNEAIPFSFVIDWASNLSQVIMQMTDLYGLTVSDGWYYIRSQGDEELIPRVAGVWPEHKQHITVQRMPSQPPRATLVFEYERFHWQRGLNAISLLIGFLPKSRS